MNKKRILSIILTVSLLALVVTGCSGGDSTEGKGEIIFADAGWDSIKFHNAIAGTIAEEIWGYTWTEYPGTTPVTHEGLLKGDIDAHMEIWTNNIASYEEDLENEELVELSTNFDDNFQGVYVPKYVIEGDPERDIEASAPDLKHVQDLKDYPDVFVDEEDAGRGRMYGAIPGWEVETILQRKHEHYNLGETMNYFPPGSEAALATAITSAYDKGEPIAAYYWEPTWLINKLDMVLLEDEPYDDEDYRDGKTEIPPVNVTTGVSNDFADIEGNEEFMEFLSNYETSSDLTGEGLLYMQETGESDYVEVAKWFLNEHPELLDEWLDTEDAETMKEAIK